MDDELLGMVREMHTWTREIAHEQGEIEGRLESIEGQIALQSAYGDRLTRLEQERLNRASAEDRSHLRLIARIGARATLLAGALGLAGGLLGAVVSHFWH